MAGDFIKRHNIPVPPEPTIVTFNPAHEKWVERTAVAYCTDQPDDHGPIPCRECLGRARDLSAEMRTRAAWKARR